MGEFEQTGGCSCRATRYRISAAPLTIYACHCADCQTRTGSAFGLSMIVARDAISVTQGETETWRRVVQNGQAFLWQRCASCGTNLISTIEGAPDILAVWPGTLDDTGWVAPKAHLWTKSAQRWVVHNESDVRYEEQPEDFSELFRL